MIKSKKVVCWNEILEGGLPPNATVMSWRGIDGGIEAAKQEHDVVMTPGSHCYFDYYQVEKDKVKEEPLAIGGSTTVEKAYAFEPVPDKLNDKEKDYILGAQGNVWTEYMATTDYVEYMVFPRATALSEVLWSSKENKNWDDFRTRLLGFRKLYDQHKVNYAKHVFVEK